MMGVRATGRVSRQAVCRLARGPAGMIIKKVVGEGLDGVELGGANGTLEWGQGRAIGQTRKVGHSEARCDGMKE